ncbi:hypothetical protein HPB48_013309 [Haemaphysalis longicornis]|uniref:Uncharacterized protein n=1 Tax=Haemaphysalis longicornis TaxID=44386 RepID=A0A9J6GN58_HAELO|nr:hypothetical protein HPB48_013309 [Haemaphysalis longicornis]
MLSTSATSRTSRTFVCADELLGRDVVCEVDGEFQHFRAQVTHKNLAEGGPLDVIYLLFLLGGNATSCVSHISAKSAPQPAYLAARTKRWARSSPPSEGLELGVAVAAGLPQGPQAWAWSDPRRLARIRMAAVVAEVLLGRRRSRWRRHCRGSFPRRHPRRASMAAFEKIEGKKRELGERRRAG